MGIPVVKMATIGLLPSPLKAMYYRMRGATIGKRVKFAPFSILTAKKITVGDDSKFGLFCFLNVKDEINIGKRVSINSMVAVDTGSLHIDNDSVIMEQCVVGGMLSPRSKLIIGKRVKIFPYCFINPTEEISIGDDVGVGGSTYIFTHGTWKNVLEGYPAAFGPVRIEDRVWLPWRVFIMPGVTIGEDVIVGASSTVTRDVPARSLSRGTPAVSSDYSPKPLTPKRRLRKLHTIFTSYIEFAQYNNKESSITEINEGVFEVTTNGKTALICQDFDDTVDTSSHDVVVSLSSLSENTRTQMASQKTVWFDTSDSSASMTADEFSQSLYDYMGRYGIRFDRN